MNEPRGPVRWSRVLAGIAVIVVLAVPCLVAAMVVTVGENAYVRRHAVSEGRAPGRLTFDAERTKYVIALSAKPDGLFDGLSRTERRAKFRIFDGEENQARCTVRHADGSTSAVRGDRQGVAETFGTSYATVGTFAGRGGRTSVDCRFTPVRDTLGTRTEAPLMVHEANSLVRTLRLALFVGVFVLAGGGTLLILRGTVWRA